MKRHESLVPLSRAHHHVLILAQVLKQDVPVYKGMPGTPEDQKEYALQKFEELLQPHMLWEERHLLPLADHYGPKLMKMTKQVREEHQQIRQFFVQLHTVEGSKLPFLLHQLGHFLAEHVRFEERRFFQKMQEMLPDQAWLTLKSAGQEN